MQVFRANGFQVTITDGAVRLTQKQADARLHNLRHTKIPHTADKPATGDAIVEGNRRALKEKAETQDWHVTGPVNFKNGEVFGWDGEPSRTMTVEPVGKREKATA